MDYHTVRLPNTWADGPEVSVDVCTPSPGTDKRVEDTNTCRLYCIQDRTFPGSGWVASDFLDRVESFNCT